MTRRLATFAWLAVALLCAGSAFVARDMEGHYAGHDVRIRPWMVNYNSIVDIAGLLTLVVFLFASHRLSTSHARRAALVGFDGAALLVAAHLTLPLWLGDGPFAPHAWPLQLIRALIFLPSLFRDVGTSALTLALLPARPARVVAALLVGDALLIAARWVTTPLVVVATVHPYCTAPAGLCFWMLACAAFVFSSSRLSSAP